MWSLSDLTNVGHVVSETAERMPDAIAVAAPESKKSSRPIKFQTITFAQLEKESNQIALGINRLGAKPGTRIALMVPPGLKFVSLVFGLFKAGMIVVLIDPGMGRKNMIQCLADAKPEGIVGIGLAQLMRNLFFYKFRQCKFNVVVDGWWPGCTSASSFESLDPNEFVQHSQTRETEAAVIFTTGSTGPPKGVLYRHRIFIEQARQIRDYFQIQPGSVDVSGFPLFALFNVAMGTTTVFPRMDATRPAEVDPLDIQDAIDQFQANQSFGSPALWNTVSIYAEKHGLSFPTIEKVFTAGAPVPPHVLQRVRNIIAKHGEVYTPYGATESLPVACNSSRVVLKETAAKTEQGFGTCVGNKFPDMNWKLITVNDDPITDVGQIQEVAAGEIGELIVQGAIVTDQYVTRTDANASHKIKDGDSFWHRMGDVGYFDEQQRFWFCGRKSHRVVTSDQTMFTIVVEGIVNTHPAIYRSALVGIGQRGQQEPVIVAEPWPDQWPKSNAAKRELQQQLLELCKSNSKSSAVEAVYLKQRLPVDIRHNSKIFREQLSDWVQQQ